MLLNRADAAKIVVVGGFFLVCSLLTEPSDGSYRLPVRGTAPKIVRPAPVPRPLAAAPVMMEESPRDRLPTCLTMLPLHWEAFPPSHLQTIDFVRQDAEDDLSPLDFETSGGSSALAPWLDDESLPFPPWLRASVKSYTTPSGNDVDVNLYVHWDDWKVLLAVRNQTTANGVFLTGYFPGVTMELYEYPLFLSRQPVLFSSRVSLWSQPTDRTLGFPTKTWGVLGSLIVEVPLSDNLWLWLEGRGKSEGWVSNNQTLGGDMKFKTGLHWSL